MFMSISASQVRDRLHAAGPAGARRISDQTVRNRLHSAGFHSRKPVKKQRLTDRHKRQRLQFARDHARWTRANWANCLFSDEFRCCMRQVDGRVRVWRRRGEAHASNCVQEVDAYRGGSVMVWGGICLQGRTDLVPIEGNLNARRYVDEVLRPHVVPFAGAVGADFVFQQDNARPHTARYSQNFLEQEGVEVMEWPANSPDLNPIEQLWDQLAKAVAARVQLDSTVNDLRRFLQEEWQRIPQIRIQRLVNSMRKRCQECLQARGGHTTY